MIYSCHVRVFPAKRHRGVSQSYYLQHKRAELLLSLLRVLGSRSTWLFESVLQSCSYCSNDELRPLHKSLSSPVMTLRKRIWRERLRFFFTDCEYIKKSRTGSGDFYRQDVTLQQLAGFIRRSSYLAHANISECANWIFPKLQHHQVEEVHQCSYRSPNIPILKHGFHRVCSISCF